MQSNMTGNACSHHLLTPRQHQRIIMQTKLTPGFSYSLRGHWRSPTLSQPPLHSQPRRGSHSNAAADQEGEVSTDASAPGPRDPEPEDSRTAIAQGLRLFEAGQYESALDLFAKAMKLPGTGIKRFRDKPREVSDGERTSALYNAACCYSRLNQDMDGLKALATALEAGYDNFDQIRQDPDLEGIRQHPKFDGLLARFEKPKGNFMSDIMNGFKS